MLLPQTHISSQTTCEKGLNPWRVSVFPGWREKLECVFCQSQLHVLSFAELNYTTRFHPTGPPFDLIFVSEFWTEKKQYKDKHHIPLTAETHIPGAERGSCLVFLFTSSQFLSQQETISYSAARSYFPSFHQVKQEQPSFLLHIRRIKSLFLCLDFLNLQPHLLGGLPRLCSWTPSFLPLHSAPTLIFPVTMEILTRFCRECLESHQALWCLDAPGCAGSTSKEPWGLQQGLCGLQWVVLTKSSDQMDLQCPGTEKSLDWASGPSSHAGLEKHSSGRWYRADWPLPWG